MDPFRHDGEEIPVKDRAGMLKQVKAMCDLSDLPSPSNSAAGIAEGKWMRGEISTEEWEQSLNDYVAWLLSGTK